MTEIIFLDLLKETIMLILMLVAPVLVTAMIVGLGISLFQAVTQIQEATLTFVPKILACLGVLILASPWMLSVYMDHVTRMMMQLIEIGRS